MAELKLTDNEKVVVKALIKDGRVSCSEIAKGLGISPQAVVKIEKKLERIGLIKGYTIELDYEKLGVKIFAIACLTLKEKSPKAGYEKMIMNRMEENPFLLRVYRMPTGDDCTHMAIYGFRSIVELEHYFEVLRRLINTHMSEYVELKSVHAISTHGVLKDDTRGFLMRIVEKLGKEHLAEPRFDFDDAAAETKLTAEKK